MARARDGGKDVVEFLVHVDVLTQASNVRGRVERRREGRRRVHEDFHAQGLRDDEDVAEDDCSVDEAQVPPYRLKGDLARQGGRPADFEKLVLSPNSAEL